MKRKPAIHMMLVHMGRVFIRPVLTAPCNVPPTMLAASHQTTQIRAGTTAQRAGTTKGKSSHKQHPPPPPKTSAVEQVGTMKNKNSTQKHSMWEPTR